MKQTILIVLSFIVCKLNAQTYEIRATNIGGGAIAVQMRVTSVTGIPTTGNFVTDIVFGIRWLSSYNVNLLTPTTNYNIIKSGTEQVSGSFEYQAFGANNIPFNFPNNWSQNVWVDIMTISNNLTGSGTGTFEICPFGFNATTNPNFGIDLTDFTPTINGAATNVPLPLDLLDFSVRSMDKNVHLTWQTANEQNVSHFQIERSKDGKNFTPLSKTEAKNGASQSYEAIDAQPLSGVSYYRLKMVDADGTYRYSAVKTIELSAMSSYLLYPNPTQNTATLKVNIGRSTVTQLAVFNLQGQAVFNSFYDLNKGDNFILINTENLPEGMYIVRFNSDGDFVQLKLNKISK